MDDPAVQQLVAETAAATDFSGVVRVDRPAPAPAPAAAADRPAPTPANAGTGQWAFGLADRRWRVPMTTDAVLGIASGTKGFTAAVVLALVESGELSLDRTARSLLGADLPLIDDAVTVEHLLAHRSGIGDYLDEEAQGEITDHVMPIPVHRLDRTEAYLPILDGHHQRSTPGERFAYNNSGFVVLALLAERATGRRFEMLVDELVCRPAGLTDTAFHRSDALPPGVATGYLHAAAATTNSLHLPVVGSGDGGLFSTAADITRFWTALFDGRIVSPATAAEMARPRSDGHPLRYGLGLWLAAAGPMVRLEGYDAGVSFVTWHHPDTGATHTVLSNTSEGAWPMADALDRLLGPDQPDRAPTGA